MNRYKLAFQELGLSFLKFLSAAPRKIEREGASEAAIDVNTPYSTSADELSSLSIALYQMGMSKHLPTSALRPQYPPWNLADPNL